MSSLVLEITSHHFESIIEHHTIVFIFFGTNECLNSTEFERAYEVAAVENQSILFGWINVEKQPSLVKQMQICSAPHLVVFKQGIAIYSEAGWVSASTLNELVGQALAVDTNQIYQQINASEY
ncbi:MAG: thioredoxin family protein [Legionella sp.]